MKRSASLASPLKMASAPREAPAALAPAPHSFLSMRDLDQAQLASLLGLASELKADRRLGRGAPTANLLAGHHVALVFEKPSLRTRSTFEIAVRELGGEVILPEGSSILGSRESIEDVARNLERWVSVVIIRTFGQRRLESFAEAAPRLHVINALTDEEHPCQALADLLTLHEHWGALEGRTLAYVGDGNNVATSLAEACVMSGIHVRIASPAGYTLPADAVVRVKALARSGATLQCLDDPVAAVRGAQAVYTDVWTSMGQEAERAQRSKAFAGFQVTSALMAHADPGALFMHCLPAHRGEEVTGEVMDAPTSVVFDQAENRLHAQKALLVMLCGQG